MGILNKVKDKVSDVKDKVAENTTGKLSKLYEDKMGITDAKEAQKAYDNAIAENTGEAGMRKASMQGQLGATSVGANAGQAAKQAAAASGIGKGASSALGESVVGDAANNAVASETQKAAQKNQEIVDNAAKKLESETADMNSKMGMIGKAAGLLGSAAGTAIGGPVGGMVGGAIGNIGADALNYGGMRALSDERMKKGIDVSDKLKDRCGFKSKIKRIELLHLGDK